MNATLTESRKDAGSVSTESTAITARLAAAGRILQGERGATLFLRACPWLLGIIGAAFVADVIFHFEASARVSFDLVFLGLLLGVAAITAWIAKIRERTLEHTARVLEERDAHLGSKLINILQLRDQTKDESLAPLTRDLARMAIDGYSAELNDVDLQRLARTDGVRLEAKRSAYWFAGFATLLLLCLGIAKTEVLRYLDPFGDHPPYSFTQIEISDPGVDDTQVVYGQNLLVTAKTTGHHPGELFLSYHSPDAPERVTTVPMFDKGDKGFTQQIEGVTTDLVLVAHNKKRHCLSKQRHIRVILTPKLENAFVKVSPPAYTGLKTDERPLQFKTLKALSGTELTFRLRSNRPLKEGRIELTRAPGDAEAFTMTPSAENEVSGTITARESGRLAFTLVDRDGHPSQENWECALQVTHDLGPDVQITNPPGDSFVAMDFVIEGVIEANDDYGVKTVRIHQALNGVYGEPRVTNYDTVTRNARETLNLDLKTMSLKSGDTITLFAEAVDTAPEPHLAQSKTVTLTVITVEEYNQFLRERTDLDDISNKYSDLLNQFHDLVEQQRAISEQLDALQKQLAQAPNETAQKKFDELVARQNEVNTQLNKLAERMDTFVRDQPLYDIEAELKETLQAKAKEIRESTRENDAATQSTAARTTNPQGQRQLDQPIVSDFKSASDQQLAKLGGAESQAQEQMLQPLEDLALMQEIMKDLNRIQDLDAAQRELAQQAKAYDRSGPLIREDQLALKNMAAQQKAIGDALKEVRDKLRNDAYATEQKFPKASESAHEIADMMDDLRLQMHAGKATDAMLQARGDQSAQLAQRVSNELSKLFSNCQSQGQGMSNEVDSYLSLQRGMNPGRNFQQMMQCRKFGSGNKPGSGIGIGAMGMGGDSGYAISAQPEAPVLGNESRIQDSKTSRPGSKGYSQMKADSEPVPSTTEKADATKGIQPVDRNSDAVQVESPIEQYSDLVEKYFKAITK
jgi:hypothetical protein